MSDMLVSPRAAPMQRSISADASLPSSPQAPPSAAASNPVSPNSLYPLVRRPSCLVRAMSTRSTSSSSSNTSSRSVRFCEKLPNVKFTYPKEVYDRAPIIVTEDLALKRCREMQDESECTGPAKWVVDCFYASNGVAAPSMRNPDSRIVMDGSEPVLMSSPKGMDEAEQTGVGSLDSAASGESLPSLSSDCSASSADTSECSDTDEDDEDDRTSNGTYSPMPSRLVSLGSPIEYDDRVISHTPKQVPSSPAQPNFLRWDLPIREEPPMAKALSEFRRDSMSEEERERRKTLRLKMQQMARERESDYDCLSGF